MRFEWFVKQILSTINGKTDIQYSILTPERATTANGSLRYVGDTISIYVGENSVTVDTPIFVYDCEFVLRAECPVTKETLVENIVSSAYGASNIFLKALFFHSVEAGGDVELVSEYSRAMRNGVVGVVRHFCQWIIDAKHDKAFYTHSEDILVGWIAGNRVDEPVHLLFSIDQDTGGVVFHDPLAGQSPSDMNKYGWITAVVTAYQDAGKRETGPWDAKEELPKADLRVMFNAGCGRNINNWELGVSQLANPALKMLMK